MYYQTHVTGQIHQVFTSLENILDDTHFTFKGSMEAVQSDPFIRFHQTRGNYPVLMARFYQGILVKISRVGKLNPRAW